MLIGISPLCNKLFMMAYSAQKSNPNGMNLIEMCNYNEEIKKNSHHFIEMQKMSFTFLEDYFNDADISSEEESEFVIYIKNHKIDLAFLFLIAIPCVLLLKEPPASLYNKSCNGVHQRGRCLIFC